MILRFERFYTTHRLLAIICMNHAAWSFQRVHKVQIMKTISVLVYQRASMAYAPYNKDWVKEKIYIMLRKQAGLWRAHITSYRNHARTPTTGKYFFGLLFWLLITIGVFAIFLKELSFHAKKKNEFKTSFSDIKKMVIWKIYQNIASIMNRKNIGQFDSNFWRKILKNSKTISIDYCAYHCAMSICFFLVPAIPFKH